MERTPKERLYWLLRLYKDKEIQAETFCDEFHLTYNHDLDEELAETERVLFREIATVAARFSPFEEDHQKYPGVYFTIEDVERVVMKKALINILLDPYSTEAEKDDAAIDLGEHFEDEETIGVLLKVSNQDDIGEMVAASCGESLAYIWLRKSEINYDHLLLLKDAALHEALSLIKAHRYDWFAEYERRLFCRRKFENNDVQMGRQEG
ncbi:hypothetical protein [Paenibacillus chitinolyticus]